MVLFIVPSVRQKLLHNLLSHKHQMELEHEFTFNYNSPQTLRDDFCLFILKVRRTHFIL